MFTSIGMIQPSADVSASHFGFTSSIPRKEENMEKLAVKRIS